MPPNAANVLCTITLKLCLYVGGDTLGANEIQRLILLAVLVLFCQRHTDVIDTVRGHGYVEMAMFIAMDEVAQCLVLRADIASDELCL